MKDYKPPDHLPIEGILVFIIFILVMIIGGFLYLFMR